MVPVLAFSLQDQVEKYGAYVGIAAFLGLAVLTLLYFAQARELKRLRDWAGRAPERAQELEARVVAQAEEARRVPEPAGTVGPARPVEQPATATAAAAAASGNGRQAGTPAPIPMGPRPAVAMAAVQAAASAPAEVAEPEPPAEGGEAAQPPSQEPDAPQEPAPTPPSQEEKVEETPEPPAEPQESEDAPAVAPGNGVAAEPPPIPRATPRPQLPRHEPAAAPLRSSATRSTTLPPRRTPPPARRTGGESPAGRIALFAVLAVVIVGAGAFGAITLLGGDDDGSEPQQPNVTTDPGQTATGQGAGSSRTVAQRPETVVVVLNGTPIEGLASDKRDELLAKGYSDEEGMIRVETNTDQTRQDSIVFYGDGQRRMARDVASVLGIEGSPGPTDPETQALADETDPTDALGAEVVVVLGADQAP